MSTNLQAGKKSAVSGHCVSIVLADFGIDVSHLDHLASVFDAICDKHAVKMTQHIAPKKRASLVRNYVRLRQENQKPNFALIILKEIKKARTQIGHKHMQEQRPSDWLENKKFSAVTKAGTTPEGRVTLGGLPHDKFYATKEWRTLRYKVLRQYGAKCMCCGATREDDRVIEVDHILPRSAYPEKALDIHNLQALCNVCNSGKSNIFRDDWTHIDDGFPIRIQANDDGPMTKKQSA